MTSSVSYATRIVPGKKTLLTNVDSAFTANLDKARGEEQLKALGDELNRLQELLYAASTHSLLIVLQGMDTSGKDGAIRSMRYFNPQGIRIESFKAPTADELAHDFLWRLHRVAPRKGMITVFNRSHYEDIVAVRVQKIAPQKVWEKRYTHIEAFENLLADSNTLIVKFFLHISKKEQEERLLAREENVEKAWKLNVGDWQQRKLWSDYQRAYEDVLSKSSAPHAPWFVIPADKKWFRNIAIAQSLIETLQPYEKEWRGVLAAQSKTRIEELKKFRAS